MKRRNAVIGSAKDLSATGARVIKAPVGREHDADVMEYRGWRFTSFHSTIIDSNESAELQDSICSQLGLVSRGSKDDGEGAGTVAAPHSPNLRIPPMIFGHDIMRIEKASGVESVFDDRTFRLSLDAEDALTLWAAQHTPENLAKHPLSVIQVPYAAIWSKLNGPASAVNHHPHSEAKASSPERRRDEEVLATPAGAGGMTGAISSVQTLQIDRRSPLWDWTFSSDYSCTLGGQSKQKRHILSFNDMFSPLENKNDQGHDSKESLVYSVQDAPSSGIEFDLLRANDVPILFYDEILLYQDDLEDCGEVVFEAKLRVMPHCWFLLSRMFLRVDGVLIRIRDNRFFHRFGTDAVHLEITWKECKLALKVDKAGVIGGEGDGEFAASNPVSVPPGHLYVDGSSLRDINKLAQIVPVVNSKNLTIKI